MSGIEGIIFAGLRIGISELLKRLGSKKLYVAILSNRDILNDVLQYFGEKKGKRVQVVFNKVIREMPLDEEKIIEIVREFKETVEANTKIGDSVLIVLACPLIYAVYLSSALHHWSRKALFTQFDLKEKTYRVYDLSHFQL